MKPITTLLCAAMALPMATIAAAPAAAQSGETAKDVNGRNVARADFADGFFRTNGRGRWTEYRSNGSAAYSFMETGRDDWSVYLDDPSRDVQLQIDLHRKWIGYGANGGAKSDL